MARREVILASILEQGKLTDELKGRIEATLDKSELEDLYLPYRPKRRTKATIAREKGLEPLALYLWAQEVAEKPLALFAGEFVNAEKEVNSVDEALVLGTQVAVLTSRPGRVRELIDLDLPRPRDITSRQFNDHKRHILNLIREEGMQQRKEARPDSLAVSRQGATA